MDRSQLKFRRNCIYCFKGGRQSREHVFPRPLGYKLPIRMVCKKCNNALGHLDNALGSDYWIGLHRGRGIGDPSKSPFHRIQKGTDGKLQLVDPYTDKASWRPVGKAAFELMAFFVQEEIFTEAFDEWRAFIRFGKPDLSDQGRRPFAMFRASLAPNKWRNVHTVTLDRLKGDSLLWLSIYGSYEFYCRFGLPSSGLGPRQILTVDLENDRDLLWRQSDPKAVPEVSRRIRAGKGPQTLTAPWPALPVVSFLKRTWLPGSSGT